jgi:hypothetical protein
LPNSTINSIALVTAPGQFEFPDLLRENVRSCFAIDRVTIPNDELNSGVVVAYSDFTVSKVKRSFGLTTVEGDRFFPEIAPIEPSQFLVEFLAEAFPLASMLKSEKAKSEFLIGPVLLEVRRHLAHRISLFSGEEFTVDPSIGLSGICGFLISQSAEQLEIEAPVIVIVEAKKADLNTGMGQCMAEMVAAQRFNLEADRPPAPVYGCVSSGTLWRFLRLTDQQVSIDVENHLLTPIDRLLGILVWMAKS